VESFANVIMLFMLVISLQVLDCSLCDETDERKGKENGEGNEE
jgi:hypothetical protein